MAANMSVSKSFLEKNMDRTFKEAKYFTKVIDARLLRWDVKEMPKRRRSR